MLVINKMFNYIRTHTHIHTQTYAFFCIAIHMARVVIYHKENLQNKIKNFQNVFKYLRRGKAQISNFGFYGC
jgi:hypothetical protein